jgi:hypothetical protein
MTIRDGYTRISSILGQWDKFGHIDPAVLAHKAEIGTRVHEAIEAHISGAPDIGDFEGRGYFESYLKWQEKSGVVTVQTEQRLYCDKLKITGAVDALVKFPGGEALTIVDYKTSAQEAPKTWPLQGCFYHYLATVNDIPTCPRIIFLKLDKKGGEAKAFEYFYSKQLMNTCLSALNCYRWLND